MNRCCRLTSPQTPSYPQYLQIHSVTAVLHRDTVRSRTCGLVVKDRDVRMRMNRLIISSFFLLVNLDIYISFVVMRVLRGLWVYIVLTFILLCLGVIWCHVRIRFIMAVFKFCHPGPFTEPGIVSISTAGAAGYSSSNQPIHIIMAGDEEQFSENHGAARMKVTIPPPAYGLWQTSVVGEQCVGMELRTTHN
ncbi:hypothetical protein BJX64DRAFT_68922 [Aspergillus heterothallicus]